jgi:hypothetical protein
MAQFKRRIGRFLDILARDALDMLRCSTNYLVMAERGTSHFKASRQAAA